MTLILPILIALSIFYYIVTFLITLGIHIAAKSEAKYIYIVFFAFIFLPIFFGMDYVESKGMYPDED